MKPSSTSGNFSLRLFFLLSFIIMTFYCYGAGMVDYFGVYETWKLVPEEVFPAVHGFQGARIVNIFVIPSAVMTLLNAIVLIFPLPHVSKKLVWLSLLAYSFDWIFSFSMQIPIQLKLGNAKSMELIDELLATNWWRFAADTCQFIVVCILLWQLIKRSQQPVARTSFTREEAELSEFLNK
jgi:hypothetical protein